MRVNAQLLDSAVALKIVGVPPSHLSVWSAWPLMWIVKFAPLTESFGEYPASSAVARVMALNDDPVWRPDCVIGLYCESLKSRPRYIARTPPVELSITTTAAVISGSRLAGR